MTPDEKMAQEIEEIRDEVHGIKQSVDENMSKIQHQVSEIRNALLGNEFNKNGLLMQVHEHERRLAGLESSGVTQKAYMNILRFIAGAITTGVITGAIGFFYWLLKARSQ